MRIQEPFEMGLREGGVEGWYTSKEKLEVRANHGSCCTTC